MYYLLDGDVISTTATFSFETGRTLTGPTSLTPGDGLVVTWEAPLGLRGLAPDGTSNATAVEFVGIFANGEPLSPTNPALTMFYVPTNANGSAVVMVNGNNLGVAAESATNATIVDPLTPSAFEVCQPYEVRYYGLFADGHVVMDKFVFTYHGTGDVVVPNDGGIAFIQVAINVAKDGDVVFIPGRVYTGCIADGLSLLGKRITVRGCGQDVTIIDCQGSGRAFRLDSGEGNGTTIEGMTIRSGGVSSGTSSPYGGAILIQGADGVVLSDLRLVDNHAGPGGGALAIRNSNVTVLDSRIQLNDAGGSTAEGPGGGGGAYVDGGSTASFVRTSFGKNVISEPYTGGGLFATNSEINLEHVTFDRNTAPDGGGLGLGLDTIVSGTNVSWTGNAANAKGASIYAPDGVSVGLSDVYFADETAVEGGCLFVNGSSSVTLDGGAAVRTAAVAGNGGFALVSTGASLVLSDMAFTNVTTTGSGGVVYADNANATLHTCTVAGSEALGAAGGVAAATGQNAHLRLTGATDLSSVRAFTDGGALAVLDGALLAVTGARMGPGVAVNGGLISCAQANLSIAASELTLGEATEGGLVHATECGVDLRGTTLSLGSAVTAGGLVALYDSSLDGVDNVLQEGVAPTGGCLNLDSVTSGVLTNTTMNRCVATDRGAALMAVGCGGWTYGGAVINCSVSESANLGAVMLTAKTATTLPPPTQPVFLVDATFADNPTGAVVATGVDVSLLRCGFYRNRGGQGGALRLSQVPNMATLSDSRFVGNAADASGGALFGTLSLLSATNVTFERNVSPFGGAVDLDRMSAAFTDSTWIANVAGTPPPAGLPMPASFVDTMPASGRAGGLRATESFVTLNRCTLRDHRASTGAAMIVIGSSANITDSNLLSNAAVDVGGAIEVVTSTLNLVNGEAANNTAVRGGVISASFSSRVHLAGALLRDNRADDEGGAVYVASGTLTTTSGAALVDNSASRGGAVFLDVDTEVGSEITNASFTGNHATIGGALALLATSAPVLLRDVDVSHNTAEVGGGGVAVFSTETSIVGSRIANNAALFGAGVFLGALHSDVVVCWLFLFVVVIYFIFFVICCWLLSLVVFACPDRVQGFSREPPLVSLSGNHAKRRVRPVAGGLP